jgi:hypothetical protein
MTSTRLIEASAGDRGLLASNHSEPFVELEDVGVSLQLAACVDNEGVDKWVERCAA